MDVEGQMQSGCYESSLGCPIHASGRHPAHDCHGGDKHVQEQTQCAIVSGALSRSVDFRQVVA
eukprot:4837834-Amphidinium_carterae.1